MLTEEELEALGVSAGAKLELLGECVPSEELPHGLAVARVHVDARMSDDELVSLVESDPRFVDLVVPGLPAGAATVRRWTKDPSVVVVSRMAGTAVPSAGWIDVDGDLVARPTDRAPAVLRLVSEHGEIFLKVSSDGRVVAMRRVEAEPPRLGLSSEPEPVPDLRVPSAAELFDAFPTEPWLRGTYEELSASTPFVRVVAVGLVGRLWAPPWGEAGALATRLDDLPTLRAKRWARENASSLGQIAQEALEEARTLQIDLEELVDILPDQGEPRREALRRLAEQRDDLASIAWVLLLANVGHELVAALARTDRAALVSSTLLQAELDVAADPRFEAVAREEPDAWWAPVGD